MTCFPYGELSNYQKACSFTKVYIDFSFLSIIRYILRNSEMHVKLASKTFRRERKKVKYVSYTGPRWAPSLAGKYEDNLLSGLPFSYIA